MAKLELLDGLPEVVAFTMGLTLCGFVTHAHADAPPQLAAASAAAPAAHVRPSTDPSVSPPVQVDPAKLKNMAQHALVQRKLGFYAVFTPPDYDAPKNRARRYPVVLILHGSGSSEVRHGSLADQFGRDGVIYVVPRAANPNEAVILKEQRIAWTANPTYPAAWGDVNSPGFPRSELVGVDVPGLQLEWIEQVLTDARKRYRVSEERAIVFGHSQGAEFAHRFALQRPELVRAYIAYAGHFEVTLDTPNDARTAELFKSQRVRPILLHHEGDERVDVQQSRKLGSYLASHGVAHDLVVLPGGDHMLDDTVHATVRKFLRAELARK